MDFIIQYLVIWLSLPLHCSLPVCERAEGDDPLIGHAKYPPKCIVLKLNHSEEFIKECRKSYIKTIECISGDNDSSDDMRSNFSDYMNSFDADSD
jgi:hypothetical protein